MSRRISEFTSRPPGPPPTGDPPRSPREALALTHHHPGRLRVRADAFRSSDDVRPASASRVLAALDAEPGITAVSHNVRTGSVLIEYQPGLADPESILSRIAAAASLEMPSDLAPRGRAPALVAIDAVRGLNGLVHELSGQRADLRSLVPVGMAALAAYAFVVQKDARLPRWDNLLYWGYSIFSQLHRPEIEAVESRTAASSPRPES